ncbi:DUF3558 domain-containing protein [Gandjariella thermophila]|uniref:DUF3558 domain-containing protein n=1 Tax=Gandjariella thermophila TaxID=1931992 RepID=UPI001865403D|nr:DUF3558 domain-containing protein [Gandjariella thermophila]
MSTALAAGCGTSQGGTPATQATPPSTASMTSTAATTPSVARPKALSMTGVDPCRLINPATLPALKIDQPPRPSQATRFDNAPRCGFNGIPAVYYITAISSAGIDVWSSGPSKVTQLPPIAGFPAVQVTLAAEPERCDVAVDVANGQQLLATASVVPGFENRVPPNCDAAQQVAQAAMSTLLQQR